MSVCECAIKHEGACLVPVPLSPVLVRETMERFALQEGWAQHSSGLWYDTTREKPYLLSLGAAVNKALLTASRRAEEGQ